MPGQKSYREVSSCSKCGSYQAIRMNMRLVYPNGTKNYPHTLNGSALAVDRVFAAILENYYNKNTKTLVIPKVLHKYMNGIKEINSNK